MLYELYQIFDINLLKYISVRSLAGFFISFFLCIIIMPFFIKWAKKFHQPINKYAPDNHKTKTKIPTMGGAVFVSVTILASLLATDLSNLWVLISLFSIISFALIGFNDDYKKITAKDNSLGLNVKTKFIAQSVFAVIISSMLYFNGFLTEFFVPFYKYSLFDMGIYSIVFWSLVIVATSNAVNLTDGLDGLAALPSFLAFISLGIIIYITGNSFFSEYLLMPQFAEIGEVAIVASCFCGSLLGFLWYNSYPAEVFMGDTGSLSIGAFIAVMAIFGKSEVLLILIGFIFVIETISVILQVFSFKIRRKRIFLMAPIHHHFEMKGWLETKIIIRFWIISLIANLLAILTIKFR